jgi:hypothetical protein
MKGLPDPDKTTGRIYPDRWLVEPWYVKDTAMNKFWAWWQFGSQYMPSAKYKSQGYIAEELGPIKFEKKGHAAVVKEAEALRAYGAQGGNRALSCPFSFA